MQPRIIARKIAAAGAYLPRLNELSCGDAHLGADRHFVALRAYQFEQHAMIVVSAFVQKKLRGSIHIHHDDVNTAVVVEVSECSSSARCVRNSGEDARNILKCSVTLVAE